MEKKNGEQVNGEFLPKIEGKVIVTGLGDPDSGQEKLKELWMNPEKYQSMPLPGTDYHQYFMGVDPATGEDKVFLQLNRNSGAIPLPRHLWEKKKPEEPMLIIEPPTEEQLEADFKWRMLEYKLSQRKAQSLAVSIAFAAGIVSGLLILAKLLFS